LRCRDLSRQLLEVSIRQRSLSSTQDASGKVSRFLIAPLVLLPTIVCRWGQRQRLGIGSRHTLAAATFLAVIVAAIAPGSTLAVAAATPATLGGAVFLVKLPDNPTIVGIVGVLLVDNAVAAMPTFVTLGAVPAALLMIWFSREDSSLIRLKRIYNF
jgi:hypothetical protein